MLQSAARHYRRSALLAQQAGARVSRSSSLQAITTTTITYQAAQARMSEQAVADMLAEQDVDIDPAGSLAPLSFTTDPRMLAAMLTSNADPVRLVSSLVQEAGRAAEGVAVAARPKVGYTRYLSPPSCSRCAILAGRTYRYSQGFQRHPGCDCVMVPALQDAAAGLVADPTDLVREGKVTGLSKDDLRAIDDGADLGQVVNVRRKAAGLTESGRVLARAGRLTPSGIYRLASSQTEAVAMLRRFGYLT